MKTRVPWFTVTVAAAAIAVHLLPSTAAWLQYDRAALGRGELWRIFTAHLTHFGANHLLWDLGVLLTFGAVCEGRSRAQCATALGVAAVAISAALWLWQPQFAIYRGLSGLDCALVGMLAGSLLRSGKVVAVGAGALALLGFAAKCGRELATAQTVFAAGAGYEPAPMAHLVGLLAGLGAAVAADRFVTHSSQSRREIVALVG
jgi:rhomboid family GlyGly-CTERM serine protease